MVQPIQYQVPGVTDPFASVVQGLRLGATLQELDFARQDRARKEEALRLQQQQQLQQQQYLSDFVQRPNKTAQDYTEALLRVPSLKDQFTESWKIENTEQTNKSLSDMGRVFAALSQGKADTAYADLSQQAADLKAAGAPQERVDAVSKMAELARTNPEFLKSLTGTRLAAQGDRGKAIVDAALKLTAAEQGRMISTPEDKIKAGLVNDKGEPLTGTFFKEPGKEPKLVSGEKPKDQFVTTNAKGLAEKFGITGAEPGLYKVNTATNEVSAIGRGGTTVNMRAEGPPPPGWQYERDAQGNVIKMAPIPGGPADTKAAEQKAASKALSNINYNPETGEDDISRLIARSTSGGAQALTTDVLRYFNITTEGAKAINALQSSANQITTDMLGGRLGAGISNTDREFILAALGDVGNPNKTARERLSGWARAKERMVKAGMLPTATPSSTPTSAAAQPTPAEAAPVSTPTVSTRALPNQAAIDFLRRNPSLRGAFDEKYGPGAAARVLGGQ